MKIYLLGRGEEDEATIYGAFSTSEKAQEAHDVFSVIQDGLWIESLEADDLERFYDQVKEGWRWYSCWIHKYNFLGEVSYAELHVDEYGLFAYLDAKENYVFETESAVWGSIRAKSKEEAREVFAGLFEKAKDEYRSRNA